MASNEDLWRELEELERRDEAGFQRIVGRLHRHQELGKRKPVAAPRNDNRTPEQRFKEDIAPVIERRRRVEAGLPISGNPIYNLFLKLTGQDKLPVVEKFDPDKDFQVVGQSTEEIRQIIAANPEAYKHLAKAPAKTQQVNAARRTAEDLALQSRIRGPIKIEDEEEQ